MIAGGWAGLPLGVLHLGCLARYRQAMTCDPLADASCEEVERNRAGAEHYVMEVAQIEAGAKRLFSLAAKLPHFQLTDLVGHGLAGPGDVAVDFVYDVVRILGS